MAGDTDPPYEPLDCTAGCYTMFQTLQNDSRNEFDLDDILSAWDDFNYPRRYASDLYNYVYMHSYFMAGLATFTVPDALKSNIKGVAIKLKGQANRVLAQEDPATFEWSPIVGNWELRIKTTETEDLFENGAEVRQMANCEIVEFNQINLLNINVGNTPFVETSYIEIPIPKSIIENLVGNTLYIWFYIAGPNFIYPCNDFKNGYLEQLANAEHAYIKDVHLEIYQ